MKYKLLIALITVSSLNIQASASQKGKELIQQVTDILNGSLKIPYVKPVIAGAAMAYGSYEAYKYLHPKKTKEQKPSPIVVSELVVSAPKKKNKLNKR